jgi:hypothetical protein
LEKDNGETPWILSYCRAYAELGRITEQDLVPAVTGEHAAEPQGKGYDWPAIRQACDDLERALPPLTAVAQNPPEDYRLVTDRTAEYVTTVSSFVRLCRTAADDEDTIAMNHLGSVLVDASQKAEALDGIIRDAKD